MISTAAIVSSDRSKENTLNLEKKLRLRPFTGDYKCSYITTEAIIGFFFNSYIPELILLDDELESLRIKAIASLAR